MSMSSHNDKTMDEEQFDVVISGMGIGGLVTAYEAAKAGKKHTFRH